MIHQRKKFGAWPSLISAPRCLLMIGSKTAQKARLGAGSLSPKEAESMLAQGDEARMVYRGRQIVNPYASSPPISESGPSPPHAPNSARALRGHRNVSKRPGLDVSAESGQPLRYNAPWCFKIPATRRALIFKPPGRGKGTR